ncbi:hypothetical protein, partial [Bifidobacterium thermophilum]|uniref:hypothetical protein n=1 Tax=Bifidobacterium thermophilum TaxID=33905 RepID=UPI003F8DAAC1
MQAFIAGYCEISLIKSVSERRNYFEPGTDEYYNRKANTSSANTIGAIGTKRGVLDFHFWLVDVSFADVESRFVRRIVVVVR